AALNEAHYERADEMRQIFMDRMLAVYRDHDELPGENIIAELASQMSYHLNKEMADSVRGLNSLLVTDTQSMVNDMCSRLNRDLHNLAKEEELQDRRERERRMNERVIAEEEAKRYAVLKRVYEESGGNCTVPVEEDTIIDKERIAATELAEIIRYLVEEGL